MNRFFTLFLFCLFVIFTSTTVSAGKKQPKTVLDYFQLLPDKYFESPKVRTEWIHHDSAIVDIPNGYLFLNGDGAQSSLTIALFKKADNSYVIGVHEQYADDNGLDIYTYNAGRWQDITARILPKEINAEFWLSHTIEMPRQGTTIIIKDIKSKKQYSLIWHKEKGIFTLKHLGK